MKVNDLSFEGIVGHLNKAIATINDPRSGSNATEYTLREVILGAFAAFFMQNESFLGGDSVVVEKAQSLAREEL